MTAADKANAAFKASQSGKAASPPTPTGKKDVKIKIHLANGSVIDGIHKTDVKGVKAILDEFMAMQPMLALTIPDKPNSVVLVTKSAVQALRIYGD